MISVIVPTLQEARYLPQLLSSLARQTTKDYLVIVADDGSTDGTQEIAIRAGCKLIVNDHIREYPSRNFGAKLADGETILFTGADVVLPSDALERISKVMQRENLDGLYLPTFPYDGPAWSKLEFSVWYALTFLWFKLTGEANASCAFFAIKRKVFEESGGFPMDTYNGDSPYSRLLSRSYCIRPYMGLKVSVSARKMGVGFRRFNREQLSILVDVFFWFLRGSSYLKRERFRALNNRGYKFTR